MPPLRTCKRHSWAVGSDDFIFPSFIAIVLRLFYFALIVATLLYIYFAPFAYSGNMDADSSGSVGCETVEPPLLFAVSLFLVLCMQILVAISEVCIFAVSSQGTVTNDKPRRWLPLLLYLRIALAAADVASLIFASWAVLSGDTFSELEQCPPSITALRFSQAIVSVIWFTLLVYALGFLLYLGPACCFKMSQPLPDYLRLDVEQDEQNRSAKKLWKNAVRGTIQSRRIARDLKKTSSLVCVKDNPATNAALDELSYAFFRVFRNIGLVPSDILAGFLILHRNQTKKLRRGGERELTIPLREHCRSEMEKSGQLRADYRYEKPKPFTFRSEEEIKVIQDMLHYMHYCIGIYGSHLHVYGNMSTGLCQLSRVTCCQCNYRCCHHRVRKKEIVNDNMCLCGFGTMKLTYPVDEDDILYVSFENKVWQIPFTVVLDRERNAVIIAIRGTLSIEDSLTSLTLDFTDVRLPRNQCPDAKVHKGYLKTAEWVKSKVEERQLLTKAFERLNATRHEEKKLVIVGHSLGGAIASTLAVLLRDDYPGPKLVCYAMSPPGCVFNFSLAEYSKDFIYSCVVGNDIIPRMNWRSLNHMKKSICYLLEKSGLNKAEIFCHGMLPNRCCNTVNKNAIDAKFEILKQYVPSLLKSEANTENGPSLMSAAVSAKQLGNKWRKRVVKDSKSVLLIKVDQEQIIPDVPSFIPGKVVHIVLENNSCCSSCFSEDEATVQWKSREDFCVIIFDKGAVDNHMPHNMLRALELVVKQNKLSQHQCSKEQVELDMAETDCDHELVVSGHQQADQVAATCNATGNATATAETDKPIDIPTIQVRADVHYTLI